jgi:hypothetical protein
MIPQGTANDYPTRPNLALYTKRSLSDNTLLYERSDRFNVEYYIEGDEQTAMLFIKQTYDEYPPLKYGTFFRKLGDFTDLGTSAFQGSRSRSS